MKKFSRELNGYNKEEVNQFLNEVIRQTEIILKRIQDQKELEKLFRERDERLKARANL